MRWNTPFNRCVECDEVITNPVCPNCLAQKMRIFISQHNKILAKQISGFSSEEGETSCILCGKKMSLCAHCFSKDIYEFLEEKNSELAKEFLNHFDFDLRESLARDFSLT